MSELLNWHIVLDNGVVEGRSTTDATMWKVWDVLWPQEKCRALHVRTALPVGVSDNEKNVSEQDVTK